MIHELLQRGYDIREINPSVSSKKEKWGLLRQAGPRGEGFYLKLLGREVPSLTRLIRVLQAARQELDEQIRRIGEKDEEGFSLLLPFPRSGLIQIPGNFTGERDMKANATGRP